MSDPNTHPDLTRDDLSEITHRTISHYNDNAESFKAGTWHHDVDQNRQALLRHIDTAPPYTILDLGCGPGRDLIAFTSMGHEAVGVDGSLRFCEMAREASGCEVLHQDFLALDLRDERFDGVFANATLFHVPTQELERVLRQLWATLKPGGVLFCSNPRGNNDEGYNGDRYGAYHDYATWSDVVGRCGFSELEHYYRPPGQPRNRQPWLATVFRKPS